MNNIENEKEGVSAVGLSDCVVEMSGSESADGAC